jgi:ribosomal protein S18 acetylase RimI-like enzyme
MASYVRGLEAKGLEGLLPPSLQVVRGDTSIRAATVDDVPDLADMHVNGIATGFLPRLGRRFMRVLYSAMVASDDSVVLVSADEVGVTGCVSGTIDTGSFYKEFLRRHWLRAVLAMFPRVLLPSNLRRVWETLRYGGDHEEQGPLAELLAMSVVPRARRRGLGLELGQRLLESFHALGVDAVKVVVGSSNEAAIAAYQRMGFVRLAQIEVHAGESSEVLVWTA